jgi:hypothetical protein
MQTALCSRAGTGITDLACPKSVESYGSARARQDNNRRAYNSEQNCRSRR